MEFKTIILAGTASLALAAVSPAFAEDAAHAPVAAENSSTKDMPVQNAASEPEQPEAPKSEIEATAELNQQQAEKALPPGNAGAMTPAATE